MSNSYKIFQIDPVKKINVMCEMVNNTPEGTCIYFDNNNTILFSSTIKNGKLNGKCKIYNNNAIYDGDIRDNILEGNAKIAFNNGVIYNGNISEGIIHKNGKISIGHIENEYIFDKGEYIDKNNGFLNGIFGN